MVMFAVFVVRVRDSVFMKFVVNVAVNPIRFGFGGISFGRVFKIYMVMVFRPQPFAEFRLLANQPRRRSISIFVRVGISVVMKMVVQIAVRAPKT